MKRSGDSDEDHFLCLLQESSLLLIRNASSPSQSTCNCDAFRPFGPCHVYLLDSLTEGAKGLCQFIGVGSFRILGGGGVRFRILGSQGGGAHSQQAHDVVTTSMRRNDVASTSFRHHVPIRFLRNQCQIITFHILKSEIIENSRIELRGTVLPCSTSKSN